MSNTNGRTSINDYESFMPSRSRRPATREATPEKKSSPEEEFAEFLETPRKASAPIQKPEPIVEPIIEQKAPIVEEAQPVIIEQQVPIQKQMETPKPMENKNLTAYDVPEVIQDGLKEKHTVILGNTTISGDITTDSSIEIYGVVIGSVFSEGVVSLMGKVTGDIKASSLLIDRTDVEGNIDCPDCVFVKPDCAVKGDVQADTVVVSGSIEGKVTANSKLILNEGAALTGEIKARNFNIVPGARINGPISTI